MVNRTIPRALLAVVAVLPLAACETTIVGSLSTTSSTSSTTTTVPIPTGDVPSLLSMLAEVPVGLGQAIVDGDKELAAHRMAQADAIWTAVGDRLAEQDGQLAEDVQRVIGLIRTATERKRPADADKALRFITLIVESGYAR